MLVLNVIFLLAGIVLLSIGFVGALPIILLVGGIAGTGAGVGYVFLLHPPGDAYGATGTDDDT